MNGFESSFTFNGTTRLGAEANFSGYFLSPSENLITLGTGTVDLDQREYDILGGARYNARKFLFTVWLVWIVCHWFRLVKEWRRIALP